VDDLIASEQLAAVRIGRSVRIRQAAIDSFIKERESGGKINREGGA
jgi:excisionase family DNA binding protein